MSEETEQEQPEQEAEERPSLAPHVEETEDGEAFVVKNPEAQTFDLEHNAPIKDELDEEVEQDQREAARASGEPTSHHLEVEQEDESLEDELQDEVLTEDELSDMAPARELLR